MSDSTLALLIKKLKVIIIPIGFVSIFSLTYAINNRTGTTTRAATDGVEINFTNIAAPLNTNETWRWQTTVSVKNRLGETINTQYGVYWCKNSSQKRGEGIGGPCAADITPDDFLETLIFEEKPMILKNTTFESTHRGVACGRVQIDIGGLGGILGGDTYDTGVSCGNQQPTPQVPSPSPTPEQIPDTTASDQKQLINIVVSLFENLLTQHFPPGSTSETTPGNPIPSAPTTQPTSPPRQGTPLDYNIPFRDTTVPVSSAQDYVKNAWPNAKMEYWSFIVRKSIDNGWNPAFVLTLWIEETGASTTVSVDNGGAGMCRGACSRGHLGCAPRQDQNIEGSLNCLFNNFSLFNNNQFAQFMQRYSGEPELGIFVNNPNFVKNVKIWYSNLVR